MSHFELGGRTIGDGAPAFVIAEAGVNHNGDLEVAIRLVDVAVEAGADAVKFQTFRADKVVTSSAPKAAYQAETTGAGESQLDMIKRLELSPEAFRKLHDHCRDVGIIFLSTPFDDESADFLDELGVVAFKIPSGEITNGPFLSRIAVKGKPLIVSTGMACLAEVEAAVRVIEDAGNRNFALLHCVSCYPAPAAEANLRAMQTLTQAFGVPVGFSDHTLGIEVSLAAVALGARIIEKHFTLDRDLPGPDHRASLVPAELRAMVRGIRAVESALGDGRKRPSAAELAVADVARRSLVAARDIRRGEVVRDADVAILRPGTGLPPSRKPDVLGRAAKVDIPAGALIQFEMLS